MRHWPWLIALALLFAIAAIELAQLHGALAAAHPAGDHAIFELNVRRALSGDQRVGPYSQGFYHPGPAYFYWLAPAYAVFGHSTFALYGAALLLTLSFVLGSCALVARYGSSFSATLALVPLLLIELGYLGDFPQFDYWPPYVLFCGFALFLFVAAGPWQFVLFRDRFIFPDAPKHLTAARSMTLIQLALVALTWRNARKREDHFIAGLCAVCAASLVAAAYSPTKIRGAVAPHHTAWISIIGLSSWVAIAGGAWAIDPPRWAARPIARFLLLLGGCLVASLI